jgi:hypothetical protein
MTEPEPAKPAKPLFLARTGQGTARTRSSRAQAPPTSADGCTSNPRTTLRMTSDTRATPRRPYRGTGMHRAGDPQLVRGKQPVPLLAAARRGRPRSTGDAAPPEG